MLYQATVFVALNFSWGVNFRGHTHTLYSKMLLDAIHVFAFFDNLSMHSSFIHVIKEGCQYAKPLWLQLINHAETDKV